MKQRRRNNDNKRVHDTRWDVAIISADKRVAVANVKLKAIQESFVERELSDPIVLPDMEITECQERTMTWLNSSYPLNDTRDPASKGATALNDGRTTKEQGHTPANLYVA